MPSLWVVTASLLGLVGAGDEVEVKFADCPPAVRKTFQAEAKGAKIDVVIREHEEDETIFWAEATVAGKEYSIGVMEDGTLVEMNRAVDDAELPIDRCPGAVQFTFRSEAFGEKVAAVGRDVKYGVVVYEAVVAHAGKSYELVVAEDGTLVEKVLVIEDEEVELSACPAAVQAAFREHSKGGTIRDITRSDGIGHPTFEAEVDLGGKVYLIDVAEDGALISKSLEAAAE
jgi:hypothetical protein